MPPPWLAELGLLPPITPVFTLTAFPSLPRRLRARSSLPGELTTCCAERQIDTHLCASRMYLNPMLDDWPAPEIRPRDARSLRSEQALTPGIAERQQRALTSRDSVRLQRDERRVAAQRVELRAAGERRHRVIPFGHAALEERQAPRVLADITEQPA